MKVRFNGLSGPGVDNAYDGFGRMTSSTNSMLTTPLTLTYLYDANSNRRRITHPDGQYFRYDYDGLNRNKLIRENNTSWLKNARYNQRGQQDRNVRGIGIQNKATFDAIGRAASLQILLPGTASDNTFGFGYNASSQIIFRTTSNDLYTDSAHFNVDRDYQVNGLNQYVQGGPSGFAHDPNGNLTADGSVTFTYDAENRLVKATGARTADLVYDPLGRLWEIKGAGTLTKQRLLYDGDALVAEYDWQGNIAQRYMHDNGADQPLVWYDGGSVSATSRRHLFNNWQGSISAITDDVGVAIGINAYDAYGIPDADNVGRFQYTGQMWIPELGLYHYKARAYSPTLGRLLQTDPIGYEDQYNLYAYVGNDPVNAVDPLGEKTECNEERTSCLTMIEGDGPEGGNAVSASNANAENQKNRKNASGTPSLDQAASEVAAIVGPNKGNEKIYRQDTNGSGGVTTITVPLTESGPSVARPAPGSLDGAEGILHFENVKANDGSPGLGDAKIPSALGIPNYQEHNGRVNAIEIDSGTVSIRPVNHESTTGLKSRANLLQRRARKVPRKMGR